MRIIRLNEQQYKYCINNLFEDVFVSGIDDKKKTATLTYNQHTSDSSRTYNRGNKVSGEVVKTNKMDNLSGQDTYDVNLKGGLTSYNITDINGTLVMKYFKHHFDKERNIKIKYGDESYDLEMENPEFARFMQVFTQKVNAVVEYRTAEFVRNNKNVEFSGVSIYPIRSSSGFNEEMAKRLENRHTLANLPVTKLRTDLLLKNTENLTTDEHFIEKNRDYYDSARYKVAPEHVKNETHMQALTTDMNRLRAYAAIQQAVDHLNSFVKNERNGNGPLLYHYYRLTSAFKNNNEEAIRKELSQIDVLYTQYQEACDAVIRAAEYENVYQNRMIKPNKRPAQAIKYTKGPSVKGRTKNVLELLKQYGLGQNLKCSNSAECETKYPICVWNLPNFQIKNFKNDTRLALKNYFQPNKDQNLVQQELQKTVGTVVVVFDDNVSGGATLSDICMQLQNLGIEYIIPITFGKMRESWTNRKGTHVINQPENGFNLESLIR